MTSAGATSPAKKFYSSKWTSNCSHGLGHLPANPDICSVLKKIEYPEWPHRPVEDFFIRPLLERFNVLRANLAKLHTMGFEFWGLPLRNNKVFLADVAALIRQERITERLLGTDLLR